MNLGDNIKEYRKRNNITQKQLAKTIDVSEITIRRYEKGETAPSIDVLKSISNVLGVTLNDLLSSEVEVDGKVYKTDIESTLPLYEIDDEFLKGLGLSNSNEYIKKIMKSIKEYYDINPDDFKAKEIINFYDKNKRLTEKYCQDLTSYFNYINQLKEIPSNCESLQPKLYEFDLYIEFKDLLKCMIPDISIHTINSVYKNLKKSLEFELYIIKKDTDNC